MSPGLGWCMASRINWQIIGEVGSQLNSSPVLPVRRRAPPAYQTNTNTTSSTRQPTLTAWSKWLKEKVAGALAICRRISIEITLYHSLSPSTSNHSRTRIKSGMTNEKSSLCDHPSTGTVRSYVEAARRNLRIYHGSYLAGYNGSVYVATAL